MFRRSLIFEGINMRKPYINKVHIILEILGYIMVLMSGVYAVAVMLTTEGQIPTHYNIQGEVDGYGSPTALLILPISMLVVDLIITLSLHLIPASNWNTGFKINPGKEIIVLTDYSYMMSAMITEIGAFTLVGTYLFDKGSNGIMLASIALTVISFITVVIFIVKAYRDNRD